MSKKPARHLTLQRPNHKLAFIASGVIIFIIFFLMGKSGYSSYLSEKRQGLLQPFYTPPKNISSMKPGDILRYEPMNIEVPGGKAYRILYSSERSNGAPTVTSGMIFIPNSPAPSGGRNVVAWAHGTIGMGDACAPSRAANPLNVIQWIPDMMARGWVVTATDYYGLGTPGTEHYLIGADEARDVLNSVRAALNLEIANSNNRFALFGHSQGGHAVLFAANLATSYTPELNLVSVAAAAPAAELNELLSLQYKTAVMWGIGPEISTSWPLVYPKLGQDNLLSKTAAKNYKRLAQECISDSVLEAILRNKFGEQYFKKDPDQVASWRFALEKETPDPVLDVPVFIAQSTADTIVLPNTTAIFVKKSCAAGSNLTTTWMSDITHIETANVAGPFITSWLDQRFQGIPAENNCDQPLPVRQGGPPRGA